MMGDLMKAVENLITPVWDERDRLRLEVEKLEGVRTNLNKMNGRLSREGADLLKGHQIVIDKLKSENAELKERLSKYE